MFHVPHPIPHRIKRWFFSRLFRIRPEGWITDHDELAELAPRVKEFEKTTNLPGLLSLTVSSVIVGGVGYWLERRSHPEPTDPILDERKIVPWIAVGLIFGWGVTYWVLRRRAIQWWGAEVERYYRYASTVRGYDRFRSGRWGMVFCFLFSACLAAMCWNSGTVIDARVIRFWDRPLAVYEHPYNEVRSISLYDQLIAPVGLRENMNLEITFDAGPPYRVVHQNNTLNRDEGTLEAVAAYVSDKSGVPVKRGGCRP